MADTLITPVAGSAVVTGVAPLIGLGAAGAGVLQALVSLGGSSGGAFGAGTLRVLRSDGQVADVNLAYGAGRLRKITGAGYGEYSTVANLRKLRSSGQAASVVFGAGVLKPLRAYQISGAGRLRTVQSDGFASAALAETYSAHAMNTVLNAVTQFQGYGFNSFAFADGTYYAAGPDGLYKLEGADDAGNNIDWRFRTGQHDDKLVVRKRLPEVVFGLRASGPLRVRVRPDDDVYYDYTLPPVNTGTIRQHRVKPGKGMEGRYFSVEVQGISNATAEIDSMQMDFVPTTRRLG